MRRVLGPFVVGGLAACSGQMPSHSEAEGSLGVGVSTLGLTVEPSLRLSEQAGLRMLAASGNLDANETVDGIDYDGSLHVGGVGVMGDYYPTGGSMRVSGGLLKHSMELTGRALGTVEVGGTTYPAIDVTSTVEPTNSVLPMVSVGYEQAVTDNFSLSADVGAIFVGEYSVSLTDATSTVSAADIAAETANAEDELNDMPVVPYIRIGGAFRW